MTAIELNAQILRQIQEYKKGWDGENALPR